MSEHLKISQIELFLENMMLRLEMGKVKYLLQQKTEELEESTKMLNGKAEGHE